MIPIRFTAAINVIAAKADKPRRFKIVAYNGGPLVVAGFDLPVIVDLSGLESPDSVPILVDHKNSVETTVGQTDRIENTGRALVLAGPVTVDAPRDGVPLTPAQQVVTRSDPPHGHRWQASIGVMVNSQQRVEAGQSVFVNNQTFVGPVIVARSSRLFETSTLAGGADSTTTVNLAARAAATQGKAIMDFETWCKQEMGIDPVNLTEAVKALLMEKYDAEQNGAAGVAPATAAAMVNLQAGSANELRRQHEIRAMCGARLDIAATAVEKNWSRAETELAMLKANRPSAPNNTRHGTNSMNEAHLLTASFALTCGANPKILARDYGEQVVDAAMHKDNRGVTIHGIFRRVLRAAGDPRPTDRFNDSLIRAGFDASNMLRASGLSTISLPGILGDSAHKVALSAFEDVPSVWPKIATTSDVANFKAHTRYRLLDDMSFEELPPGGHLKHGKVSEESYSVTAKTYGKMFALDRTSIINDDLGAFDAIPKRLGRAGGIAIEKQFHTLVLANAGDFFGVGNANLLTGGGSALSVAALQEAEEAFNTRTDAYGNPLMLKPTLLYVPVALSVTARQLVRDTQVVAVGVGGTAATTPGANPFAGQFEVVPSAWLQLASLTGYSAAAWYLIAAPMSGAGLVEVAFLNGAKSPTIENATLDFDQLGIQFRAFHDWGIALQDHRFGVKNAGA